MTYRYQPDKQRDRALRHINRASVERDTIVSILVFLAGLTLGLAAHAVVGAVIRRHL